jgi:hypothetical protein
VKGGIFLGGYGQTLQDTIYRVLIRNFMGTKRKNCHALSLHGGDDFFLNAMTGGQKPSNRPKLMGSGRGDRRPRKGRWRGS